MMTAIVRPWAGMGRGRSWAAGSSWAVVVCPCGFLLVDDVGHLNSNQSIYFAMIGTSSPACRRPEMESLSHRSLHHPLILRWVHNSSVGSMSDGHTAHRCLFGPRGSMSFPKFSMCPFITRRRLLSSESGFVRASEGLLFPGWKSTETSSRSALSRS